LKIDSEGRVSGRFHTAVGRSEVTHPSAWFDIVGFVNGDVIGFVVSWGPTFGAISNVTGHFISAEKSKTGVKRIETLSYTGLRSTDADQWKRTTASSNLFEPGEVPSEMPIEIQSPTEK
jgi:hypothetical protein